MDNSIDKSNDDSDKFEIVGNFDRLYFQPDTFNIFNSEEFEIVAKFYEDDFGLLMWFIEETKGFELKQIVREHLIDTQFKFSTADKESQLNFFPYHRRLQIFLYSIIDAGGKLNQIEQNLSISKFKHLFIDNSKFNQVINRLISHNYISINPNESFNWLIKSKKQGELFTDLLISLKTRNLIKKEYFKPAIIARIFAIDFNNRLSTKTFQREMDDLNNRKNKFAFLYL